MLYPQVREGLMGGQLQGSPAIDVAMSSNGRMAQRCSRAESAGGYMCRHGPVSGRV
jgi:hypothetical protein